MDHANAPDSITTRLREGFERIALVLRADAWSAAGAAGLHPTQAQVLGLLAGRPNGLRAKEIAVHLGVAPPTIADSLAALERKGLISRAPDPTDGRASRVRMTEEGHALWRTFGPTASHVQMALAELPPNAQMTLLRAQIAIIRSLQHAGAIPVQRMCVTCRHFRANTRPGTPQPHHCAFVNAPIGDRDLRLDCGEHETADPAVQSANWAAFDTERPTLQAQP